MGNLFENGRRTKVDEGGRRMIKCEKPKSCQCRECIEELYSFYFRLKEEKQ